MLTPSFKLSKKGKNWWATGKVPGGKIPFSIDCGDGSEAAAKKIAEREVKRRAQMAEASRIRWRKFHAEKAAAAAAPADDQDDELPEDLADQLEQQREEETPAERPEPAPPKRTAEELRAKLLSVGDSAIEPDEVIPPGQGKPAADDDDPIDDDETPQLIADIAAGAIVNWHTRKLTSVLKKRKPPRRPGEPHEKALAWEHDGIAYNMKKLVGRSAALGPTGKMLVGATVVTLQILLESEPADQGESKPASAPAAAPAPAEEPRGNANGEAADEAKGSFDGKPELSLVKKPNPGVGKFQ